MTRSETDVFLSLSPSSPATFRLVQGTTCHPTHPTLAHPYTTHELQPHIVEKTNKSIFKNAQEQGKGTSCCLCARAPPSSYPAIIVAQNTPPTTTSPAFADFVRYREERTGVGERTRTTMRSENSHSRRRARSTLKSSRCWVRRFAAFASPPFLSLPHRSTAKPYRTNTDLRHVALYR